MGSDVKMVLPENALRVLEPAQMSIITIIYVAIIAILCYIIYKNVSPDFLKFTKGKIIATLIIVLFGLIGELMRVLPMANVHPIQYLNLILGIAIAIVAWYFVIAAIVNLFSEIKSRKSNTINIIRNVIIIVVLNGYTLKFVLFFLMVFGNLFLFS